MQPYRTCRNSLRRIPMRASSLTNLGDLVNPADRKTYTHKIALALRTVGLIKYPVAWKNWLGLYYWGESKSFQNGTIYLQRHTGKTYVNYAVKWCGWEKKWLTLNSNLTRRLCLSKKPVFLLSQNSRMSIRNWVPEMKSKASNLLHRLTDGMITSLKIYAERKTLFE